MELERYADRLRAQLVAVAEAGPEEARALAERMSVALEPAIRLALLELLSEAAGEITSELAPGGGDVRLRGQEPELVVTRPPAPAAPAPAPSPSASAPSEPADDEPAS